MTERNNQNLDGPVTLDDIYNLLRDTNKKVDINKLTNDMAYIRYTRFIEYVHMPDFKGFNGISYREWEDNIEEFFSHCNLSEREMYFYARDKLAKNEEADKWWQVYGEGCEYWYQMKHEFQVRYLRKRRLVRRCPVELKSEPKPYLQIEPEPELQDQVEPRVQAMPHPESETKLQVEPESDLEVQTKTKSDFVSVSKCEPSIPMLAYPIETSLESVEHADFVIAEPSQLTPQQILLLFLRFQDIKDFSEDIHLSIMILCIYRIRGRVFSNKMIDKSAQSYILQFYSPGGEYSKRGRLMRSTKEFICLIRLFMQFNCICFYLANLIS